MCHFSPSVSSHRQKMTQMTQFCILTHSDVADGWVIFFYWKVWRFFFRIQWMKVFSFPKFFTSLKSKWCIPKGWHVGSYFKGLDQWFSTGGA